MQAPRWNDLQDFLAIARAGQLGRAAALAGIDPATMGRHLRRLERALGTTLFEQTREGQVLTEAGEQLLAHVELMQQGAEAITSAPAGQGEPSGLLRVSVSEGFGTWFVASRLASFTARHPAVTIDLVANSGFLSPSKREADIAVLLARPQSGPVIARKLTDYRLRLYAARSFVAEWGVPDRDRLAGLPLVGYVPDLIYAPELRYWAEVQEGLTPSIRSSSINAQARLIAGGGGVGILPRFIGDHVAELMPVLPELGLLRSFWMVTHRDTHRLARVRAFRTWLTEAVAAEGALFAGA